MAQMNGYVEIQVVDDWYAAIELGALLNKHLDLNACLFGVDNHAHYEPLFADRGIPDDCSARVAEAIERFPAAFFGGSWASYEELSRVDWDELATAADDRVHEIEVIEGVEKPVSKWLNSIRYPDVRAALATTSEVRQGNRVFRRPIIARREALVDTHFPVLLELMQVLANTFGPKGVRLVVYFD